jgi:hypothetical protein
MDGTWEAVRMVGGPVSAPKPISYYATLVSVGLAVVVFGVAVVVDLKYKLASGLESHMKKAAAAGTIPTALLLIWGAVDPSLISQLSGLNVPIAAAGLALLYISARTIFTK